MRTRLFPLHVIIRAALVAALAGALAAARAGAQSTDSGAARAAGGAGAYTAEQADRGSKVFGTYCTECHARKDMSNDNFKLKWNGTTAFDLFDRITTSMPEKAPGTLQLDEYIDVLSYLLQLNGLPTGAAPLTGDGAALKKVKLEIGSPSASSSSSSSSPAAPSAHGPLHRLTPRGH